MRRPNIGITAATEKVSYGVWEEVSAFISPASYVRAVQRAGGRPILLLPDPEDAEDPNGVLATMRELTLFYAPNINSYKRFAVGSFAPTAVAWGKDNRTCSMRVVGHGPSLRVENRLPGGDVNPYLAIAAMIAAGLHGIDNELPLEDEIVGSAYFSDKPRVPTNLHEARELFADSETARTAFGEEVVEHYLNMARVEIEAFEAAVTDWERYRTFERL